MPKKQNTKSKEKKHRGEARSILEVNIAIGAPSLAARVLFAKNLAVMLRAGMPLLDALRTVHESLSGRLRTVLGRVIGAVESGVPLSDAFARYPRVFPDVFVSIVAAGERSGTLAENLEHIAGQLKKDKDLRSKVRGAMIYPVVILVAAFALAMGIAFFILPEIVPLFTGLGVELPATTRALIAFSGLVEAHGVAVLVGTVLGISALMWLSRQRFSRPVTHFLVLHLPIFGRLTQQVNVARAANTLGAALGSGISIDNALSIAGKSAGNYYYARELARIESSVRAGAKFSDELLRAEKLFPAMAARMLAVGEESGKFEETLRYLADFYEDEVDASVKTMTTMLEPLLLLGIGGAVGFLALSIISPIYDITGNVQR